MVAQANFQAQQQYIKERQDIFKGIVGVVVGLFLFQFAWNWMNPTVDAMRFQLESDRATYELQQQLGAM